MSKEYEALPWDALSLKAREAVAELIALIESGFTGNLSIDFQDGVPVVCKRTKTWRFGKREKG